MESANKELRGELKTTMLTITNKMPTINGMYQCFTEFLIEFKNDVFIRLFFKNLINQEILIIFTQLINIKIIINTII